MTRLQAIAWDFDGVLNANTRNGRLIWADRFEQDIGHPLDGFVTAVFGQAWPRVLTGQIDLETLVGGWCDAAECGLGAREIMRYWFDRDAHPDQAMLTRLDALQRMGRRQVIATNNEAHRARFIANEMGFEQRVERIFASGPMGIAKPDPAFFTLIEQQMDLPPDALLLIDDHAANVAAAREAGWKALLFEEGEYAALDLALDGLVPV